MSVARPAQKPEQAYEEYLTISVQKRSVIDISTSGPSCRLTVDVAIFGREPPDGLYDGGGNLQEQTTRGMRGGNQGDMLEWTDRRKEKGKVEDEKENCRRID
jgi:hypothetical protein